MDNARKKLRVCLICVVMAAVVVGLIYYFNDVREKGRINEGTLVEHSASDRQCSGFGTRGTGEADARESRG